MSSSDGSTTVDQAVQQLADRVVSIPNLRGPLRVQFFEDGGLAAETGKDWQETFRKELDRSRLTATEDASANLLRVGLALTPTEVVLSAGVRVNEKAEVRVVTLPRAVLHAASLPVVAVRIEKQLVFQSTDRILDAAPFADGNESGLLLLAYRGMDLSVIKIDASRTSKQSASLSAAGVRASRDLWGEVSGLGNETHVSVPGKSCAVGWAAAGDVKCVVAKPLWRMPVVLTPACDGGKWKLAADGADWSGPDLLQAVPDAAARKGSTALLSDFPGPILSVNAGAEESPDSALVVSRNLRTGNYEVYKVTLACGD